MAATLSQFRSQVPELDATADATVTRWLALTLPRVNPALFGAQADVAQVWLTAHELTLDASAGVNVPVVPGASSVAVGPVSVSYATPFSGTAVSALERTRYGQRFAALLEVARFAAASLLMPAGEVL